MLASLPDIVVGIDFGLTCTGVSYCFPKQMKLSKSRLKEPEVINIWKENSDEIINKVPTVVGYLGQQVKWGLFVPETWRASHFNAHIEQGFKLLLQTKMLEKVNEMRCKLDPANGKNAYHMDRIKSTVRDFLSGLYGWITSHLEEKCGKSLSSMDVEFLFTVPTTWDSETVRRYEGIIKDAGYGKLARHTAKVTINEATAAAAHTALCLANNQLNEYKRGDTVIVCDAGGGTTDVSALEVTDVRNHIAQLKQLDRVEGGAFGSFAIDKDFQKMVKERLSREISLSALKDFQSIKASVGEDLFFDPVRVRIGEGGKPKVLDFSRSEIEGLFITQLEGIYKLIDSQLHTLEKHGYVADYLILSGGLGSSKYIQKALQERYGMRRDSSLKVLIAKDPQLVVCRGAVMHRVLSLLRLDIIPLRSYASSFGVVYNELWNEKKHGYTGNKRKQKFKEDGRYYIRNRIHWFVDQLDPMSKDDFPKKVPLSRSFGVNKGGRIQHQLVRFDGDIGLRPEEFVPGNSKDCWCICDIDYMVESNACRAGEFGMKEQRRPGILGRLGLRSFVEMKYELKFDVSAYGFKVVLSLGSGVQYGEVKYIEADWEKDGVEKKIVGLASDDDQWEEEDSVSSLEGS